MSKQDLTTEMNTQLANWNVLNTKLHHYHWFVTGENFFTLHEKFEEYYTEAAGHIDEIAERILTIGASPLSTLKAYLDNAAITEASGNETPAAMVEELVNDFTEISSGADKIIALAEEHNDEATADMFIGIKASLEKHVWMLNAYLARQPHKPVLS